MLACQGKMAQGSLVALALRGQTRYFFIGPVMKKPQVQILLRGIPTHDGDHVAISNPGEQMLLALACAACLAPEETVVDVLGSADIGYRAIHGQFVSQTASFVT